MVSPFSARDLATLKEMARAHRATPTPVQGRPKNRAPEPKIQMAPEVYVAKPQSAGGIAARVGDTPGSGPCDIYQTVNGVLVAVAGLERTVLNLSTSAIPQDFFSVKRDKFGDWFASTPSESQASAVAAVLFGLTTGTVASTDETFSCDGIVVLSPTGAAVPSDPITGIENILHFPAANNDEVLIFRLGATSTYYGIPHPERTVCP